MFLGLVVGSMITDVDGYEEDRRAGVRTIYTSLGIKKGLKAVAALIFLVALTPLFIFQNSLDFVAFPVLGAAAVALFLRYKGSRPVLLVALIGLLYASLRYLSVF
jgi:4-hydroxybenzoate polyprenyltransferase